MVQHGVCTHFRRDHGPWSMQHLPEVRHVLGAQSMRDGVLFRDMRQTPTSRTNFSKAEHLFRMLDEGYHVTCVFAFGHPEWGPGYPRSAESAPNTADQQAIWADWVAETTERLLQVSDALAIEVWNEAPSWRLAEPLMTTVAALQHQVWPRIKAIDPDIPVLGGAMITWKQLELAQAFADAGGPEACDVVVLHTYGRLRQQGFYDADNYVEKIRDFHRIVGKPLAVTEWRPPGRPPTAGQITAWMRAMEESGVVEMAHYYPAVDFRSDGGRFADMGLCSYERSPHTWRIKDLGDAWRTSAGD